MPACVLDLALDLGLSKPGAQRSQTPITPSLLGRCPSGSRCPGRGEPGPARPALPAVPRWGGGSWGGPGRAGSGLPATAGTRSAMEAQSLPAALALVAGGGAGLSPERQAALGASLPLVQRDYRFERVWFWGCIQGVRGAYYIAEGLGPDRAAPRSRLYRCGGRPGSRDRPGRSGAVGSGDAVAVPAGAWPSCFEPCSLAGSALSRACLWQLELLGLEPPDASYQGDACAG